MDGARQSGQYLGATDVPHILRSFWVLIVLGCLAPACTGDDDTPQVRFGDRITAGCGPVDQREYDIVLADGFDPETCATTGVNHGVLLVVWIAAVIDAPQTIDFSARQDGYAVICPDGEPCVEYPDGDVTFDVFDDRQGASGTYSVDDGELTGSFDATWCGDVPLCG